MGSSQTDGLRGFGEQMRDAMRAIDRRYELSLLPEESPTAPLPYPTGSL